MLKQTQIWTDSNLAKREAVEQAEEVIRTVRNAYRSLGMVTHVERLIGANGNICYTVTAVKEDEEDG